MSNVFFKYILTQFFQLISVNLLQNVEKYDTIEIVSWLLAILYKTSFLTNRIGKKQQGGIFM